MLDKLIQRCVGFYNSHLRLSLFLFFNSARVIHKDLNPTYYLYEYKRTRRVMHLMKGDFGRIIMVIIFLPKAIISNQIEGLIYSGTKQVNSEGQRVNCIKHN
jgi:hypothetical protein